MIDSFEATTDFTDAIVEIEMLIDYAKENTNTFSKYALFNKSSIILLCTKFETFLENFLQEYAYINLKTFDNKTLDTHIYEHILKNQIELLKLDFTNKENRDIHLENVINLCGSHTFQDIQNFNINSKFNYGKHGQKEIEKLLREFGLNTELSTEIKSRFFNNFNALNAIRNNIIHEDATPSLTHQDVEFHLNEIKTFIFELNDKAMSKYNSAYLNV